MSVYTPDGAVAGYSVVEQPGVLKFADVYGVVAGSAGFRDVEALIFKVNGFTAEVEGALAWSDDKLPHEVTLNLAFDPCSVYLPVLSR